MRAILFPGQGSQYVGMGSDFYEKFRQHCTAKCFCLYHEKMLYTLYFTMDFREY